MIKDPSTYKESDIESRLLKYCREVDVLFEKFTSPSKRSVPDRLLTFWNGVMILMELKRPGGKPTEKQERDHNERRRRGVPVYVVDNVDEGKRIIDTWIEICGEVPA